MKVLFVDRRDAAATQIARALYERRGGEARSGGLDPASSGEEAVAEALEEIGLAARPPRRVDDDDLSWADRVVRTAEDWSLSEPVGLCLEEVRELRAVIEERVSTLPI